MSFINGINIISNNCYNNDKEDCNNPQSQNIVEKSSNRNSIHQIWNINDTEKEYNDKNLINLIESTDQRNTIRPYLRCNIKSCIECHGEEAIAILNIIKENKKANKPNQKQPMKRPRTKYCIGGNCSRCQKIVAKIEQDCWIKAIEDLREEEKKKAIEDEDRALNDEDFKMLEDPGSQMPMDDIIMEENKTGSVKGKSDTLPVSEDEIQNLKITEFNEISVRGDGNCLFSALLELRDFGARDTHHFRQMVVDWVREFNPDDSELSEDKSNSIEQYLNNMAKDGVYGGYIELAAIARKHKIRFAIYLSDTRYNDPKNKQYTHNKWQIIDLGDYGQPRETIFLKLRQSTNLKFGGHYTALTRKIRKETTSTINPIGTTKSPRENIPNQIKTTYKTTKYSPKKEILTNNQEYNSIDAAIINIRSIRSVVKKNFVTEILHDNNIKVAFIQETWLDNTDHWYSKGFRIYRSNNSYQHRKGVAIMVHNDIKMKAIKTDSDANGRYVTVKLIDRERGSHCYLSSIYLEPDMQNNIGIIPDNVLNSDIVGADMNNALSGFNVKGMFHFKGFELKEELRVPNTITDHQILIGKCKLPTTLVEAEESIKIISKKKMKANIQKLKIIFEGKHDKDIRLEDPKTTIINHNKQYAPSNVANLEEWETLIKEEKKKNSENKKERYKELGRLIQCGKIDKSSWNKINGILRLKRKADIWKPDIDKDEVIQGFKDLYEDRGHKKCSLNDISGVIKDLLNIAEKAKDFLTGNHSQYMPKSRAKDYNGFGQGDIIEIIKGQNAYEDLINFRKLMENIWSVNDGRKLFIHRTSKIILFKKAQDVKDFKDLRPISIIPAFLIVLEKLIQPIIKQALKGKISLRQYGFRDSSDVNMAKVRLAFLARKKGLKKALLVDLRKAYDTVDLEILKKKIKEKFSECQVGDLLIKLIQMYQYINLDINGEKIEPTRGLPQGSALAPYLFSVYIDGMLEEMNKGNPGINVQAFVDDIVIQGETVESIQIAFDKLNEYVRNFKMAVNLSKCVYISNDLDEVIMDDSSGEMIVATEASKYLGQLINTEGEPVYGISKKDLGKIIDIMMSAGSLSRKARIRIFKTYSRSKIGHLIPMIALSKNLEATWKTLRSSIYRTILAESKFPRESAALLKISYFDIIIKPLLRIIERADVIIGDQENIDFLKEASIECFKYWLICEPNWSMTIKKRIADTIDGLVYYNSEEWEKIIRLEAVERLFKGHINDRRIKNMIRIKEPDVILYMSNSPAHEIRQRITAYLKSEDEVAKEIEYEKATEILTRYILGIRMSNEHELLDMQEPERTDTLSWIEYYSIKEVRIQQTIDERSNEARIMAKGIVTRLIEANEYRERKDNYEETQELRNVIESFRNSVASGAKETWENLEIMLNLELKRELLLKMDLKEKTKNKPGRPPMNDKANQKKAKGYKTLEECFGM